MTYCAIRPSDSTIVVGRYGRHLNKGDTMSPRRILTILTALALYTTILAPAASAGSAASTEAAPIASSGPSATERAARFRAEHGLRSDAAFVERSLKDAAFSNLYFGVPLTGDEAAAVVGEVRSQDALLPTLEAARGRAGFVGAFFTRDQLTISVSVGHSDMEAMAATTAPGGAKVKVQTVPYSLDELEATRKRVESDWDVLAAEGITISQVGIDASTGRVHVIVADDGTGSASERFASTYGPIVTLETLPVAGSLLACTSIKDCGTKGGLAAKAGPYLCSTGFLAQETANVFSPVRMLTAGHCISGAGGVNAGSTWSNELGTTTWGKGSHLKFDANLDGGAFSLGSSTPTTKNDYFVSTTDIRKVRGVRTNANQVVGLTVCRSGRTSLFDCGTIRAADTSVDLGAGFIFRHMWKVQMDSASGDSGAGFIDLSANMNAVGILSGGTREGIFPYTLYTWYSSVQDAQIYLNLKTCGAGIAPSC